MSFGVRKLASAVVAGSEAQSGSKLPHSKVEVLRHELAKRACTEDDATPVLRQERQTRGHWNPGAGVALDPGRSRRRAERPKDRRPCGSAPLPAQGQARDFPPPVGRAVADGALRLQAAARKAARDRIAGNG